VVDIVADDLFNDGDKEIVVIAHDPNWYPSRLILLDKEGSLLGEYFHPGHLRHVETAEMSPDGRRAVICAGPNNDLRQIIEGSNDYAYHYAVFLLDCQEIWGQAPPYFGEVLQRGSEKWYRVVFPQGRGINSLEIIRKQAYSQPTIEVKISDGRFFYLGLDGEIVGTGVGDTWIREHKEEEFDTFYLIEIIETEEK